MSENVKTVTFAKDDIIFEANMPANTIYVLQKGELGVRYGNNPEVQVGLISPGESFGESALLAGAKRTATISCLSETTVLSFEATQFQSLFKRWPVGKIMCQCVLIEMLNANENLRKQATEDHHYDSLLLTTLVDNAIKSTRTLAQVIRSKEELLKGWLENNAFLVTGGHSLIIHGNRQIEVESDWCLGACELIIGKPPGQVFSVESIEEPLMGWFIPITEPFTKLEQSHKGLAAIVRGIAHKTIRANGS